MADLSKELNKELSKDFAYCEDTISRKAAIDALYNVDEYNGRSVEAIRNLPSAQPDNQTNLCDSCDYSYPDCPSKNDDVIFGNGIGNDNICACNKYKPSAQTERRWIPCSERLPEYDGEKYLVTVYCESINRARIHLSTCYINREGFWGDVPLGYTVVAWMPLPEPYRAKRRTDE